MNEPAAQFVADADGRADAVVSAAIGPFSRRQLRELFASGSVRVDGSAARKGDWVRAGQAVTVVGRGVASRAPVAVDMDIDVVYVDDDLVAINKPALLATHPLREGEANTAANWLVERYPETRNLGDDEREAGWVHRLDQGTSGVLVAARNRESWLAMRKTIANRATKKTYVALACGELDSGQCAEPLRRVGKKTIIDTSGPGSLAALTRWSLTKVVGVYSLLEVELVTGRTHQIRAHLAHVGHPLAGDALYGDNRAPLTADGQFLHAASVSFDHPRMQTRVVIRAPLPANRERALQALG